MLGQADGLKQEPKIISIVSGKGGVGKSIMAVNLSIAINKLGKKVLLYDVDVGFGSVEILLGTSAKLTIKDYFQNKIGLDEIVTNTKYGIDVISGGLDVEDLVYFNAGNRDSLFRDFSRIMNRYDYIVLDFPPGYNENLENFYEASDFMVLITTSEPTSLINAYTFLKMMALKGIDPDELHVVLNMARDMKDARKFMERFIGVIERFIGMSPSATHIMRFDNLVRKSVESQKPFVFEERTLQPSLVIYRIANIITKEHELIKRRTFLDKLKAFLRIG
ncbi:MAG: AAA family ATPase [Thermotogaceae bacterium]|nr:AAA family ATPase [Thermotogaceae bacterium]